MLLDSNIVIYSILPEHGDLRRFVNEHATAVSAISQVEVLGFHRITVQEKRDLEIVFAGLDIRPVSHDVIMQAVALRQQKKMTLGDAIIAATCLVL